jgi:hypothetical protein
MGNYPEAEPGGVPVIAGEQAALQLPPARAWRESNLNAGTRSAGSRVLRPRSAQGAASSMTECRVLPVWRSSMPITICETP